MIVIFLAKELTASTAQCALKVFLYGKAKMVVRMQSLNPKTREDSFKQQVLRIWTKSKQDFLFGRTSGSQMGTTQNS